MRKNGSSWAGKRSHGTGLTGMTDTVRLLCFLGDFLSNYAAWLLFLQLFLFLYLTSSIHRDTVCIYMPFSIWSPFSSSSSSSRSLPLPSPLSLLFPNPPLYHHYLLLLLVHIIFLCIIFLALIFIEYSC